MHQFQNDMTPVAAKDHICDECGRTIPKGTKHHLQNGMFDGCWYTWRVHSDCAELYWRANREYYRWDDDMMRLSDFCISELEPWRGHFPHAVTRLELSRELALQRLADLGQFADEIDRLTARVEELEEDAQASPCASMPLAVT